MFSYRSFKIYDFFYLKNFPALHTQYDTNISQGPFDSFLSCGNRCLMQLLLATASKISMFGLESGDKTGREEEHQDGKKTSI
jgi:hypothetical protein